MLKKDSYFLAAIIAISVSETILKWENYTADMWVKMCV